MRRVDRGDAPDDAHDDAGETFGGLTGRSCFFDWIDAIVVAMFLVGIFGALVAAVGPLKC